jgi:Zn-dependent protease
MFPRAFRIARISGIDVRVDPSWLIIAALVVWSFLSRFTVGDRPGVVALAMALGASLGFFGSVLAHELAHALEARHRNLEVHGITLFLFGGVTEMDMRTKTPRDEFAVAAVGPYTSFVLAAAFGLITAGIDEYVESLTAVSAVTGILGWINLGLALFNLVPGAPLDGGRVLRSGLWQLTGNRHRAGILASRAGQLVAALLWGFAMFVVLNRPEALFSALWLAFIGWFMFNAARNERAQAELLGLIEGQPAGILVGGNVPTLPPDVPLALVDRQVTTTPEEHVYPVVESTAEAPRMIGALTVQALERIDPFDRGFRTVRDVMTPVADLPGVDRDAALLDLLVLLQEHPVVAITDGGDVVGVVDRRRAYAALRRLRRLGEPRPPEGPVG